MPTQSVKTAINYLGLRAMPPDTVAGHAQMLERSEAVDYLWMWDVISGWVPPCMWTPELLPAARSLNDCYSWYDMRVQLGMAAAATDRLGVLGVMPVLRHGPAELMQTMMTVADATNGNAVFGLGIGEAYNTVPFGYKRAEGLTRYEEHFKLYQMLWENDEPFDFEGKIFQFKDASIGGIRNHKPKVYALGAGPKLLDIAARYADGWMTAVPLAFAQSERYAKKVEEVKRLVEKYGRDPEQFGFAVQAFPLIHEDPEVIESTYDNPVMKLFVATIGRFEQGDWELEGFDSPFPKTWNYSVKWVPSRVTRDEVDSIIARVSPDMVRKAWSITGSPDEVAASLRPFVEAGATLVAPFDYSPFILGLEEGEKAIARSIEVCRLLKAGS